ncbi:MAG: hypothetical protein AB7O26_11960 [Planctomycetaceae bacterium]
MTRRNWVLSVLFVFGALLAPASDAFAQGVLWTLPADGAWVRYEGTYKQVEFRPNSTEGDIALEWIQHLTIKSVGTENAEFKGETVPCRWIELKVVTGRASEAGVDPGPVGARIFKVLVPEKRVVGKTADDGKIPVAFIDIVKGYRKYGDGEVKPIDAKALQVYPLIALVMHYEKVEAEGTEAVDPQIPLGAVQTQKSKAVSKFESPTSRTTSEAQMWTSTPEEKKIPFGLAKWTIKTIREAKDSSEPRSAFKAVSEVNAEMSAHEVGEGAQSELTIP